MSDQTEYPDKPKKPHALRFRNKKRLEEAQDEFIHVYHGGARCETDTRGHATPGGRSPLSIVVDASDGFIPLWAKDVTLRWRFQEQSMLVFNDPDAAKDYIRDLLARAIALWDYATPVRFSENDDAWDFEIAMSPANNCNSAGACTLARAFFPDAGQHDLMIYPRMFDQVFQEQVETLAHEIGHIFGLRHFFANISETAWPSAIVGEHKKFTIMNYGPDSVLTDADRKDLSDLYNAVWDGTVTDINGTPVHLFEPFSSPRLAPMNELLAALRIR